MPFQYQLEKPLIFLASRTTDAHSADEPILTLTV
jgi:hypothetical protein